MARFCKFLLFTFLPFYFLTVLLFSCQEGRDAGDLWGQWRQNGTDDKYISFSGSVTVFRNAKGRKVFGNFQHVGDSLFIQCSSIKGEPNDTVYIEEHFGFKPFTNIRLRIDHLDSEDLVLSQDGKTWSFYKY